MDPPRSTRPIGVEVEFLRHQQRILELVATGAPLERALDGIVRLVEAQSSEMLCSILLLDRAERVLHHGAAPSLPRGCIEAIDGMRIGPWAGACGAAAYRAEPVEVEDIDTHDYCEDYRGLARSYGLKACWSTPILSPEREVLGTFAMYYRVRRPPREDERRWVASATHLAGIAIRADRTRAMEAALLHSETELRAIFEQTAIGIGLVAMNRRYVRVNPALCELLGYSADELIGKDPRDVTHPDDWGLNAEMVTEMKAGRRPSVRLQKRYVRKDGSLIWGQLTASLVRDKDDKPLFVVSMVQDISTQKRLEDEVLRTQRLDGLSRLAQGIAHDFNNVLTTICGSTVAALEMLDRGHLARPHLEDIDGAAVRATELVRRILAFSPEAEPQRALRPLAPILHEVARVVRARLSPHTTLRTDIDEGEVWVHADPTQLQQLVMNLVINAVQVVPEGGSITLGLDERVVDETVRAPVGNGRWARIEVVDDGPGIPPDALSEIFEPFFTTRPQGQGSGLGLAIVRAIAAAHDGSVTVASTLGHGSTFEVWLPLVAGPDAPAIAPNPRAPVSVTRPGGRVLVVDDEALIGRLAKRELEKVGFHAETFTDPEAALVRFKAEPKAFDAVVTDASMPRLSGFELVRAIKATRPDIPIIVISGGLWNRESLEELGVSRLLLKPEALREIAPTLQELLR